MPPMELEAVVFFVQVGVTLVGLMVTAFIGLESGSRGENVPLSAGVDWPFEPITVAVPSSPGAAVHALLLVVDENVVTLQPVLQSPVHRIWPKRSSSSSGGSAQRSPGERGGGRASRAAGFMPRAPWNVPGTREPGPAVRPSPGA